jgi:hypothetical protein
MEDSQGRRKKEYCPKSGSAAYAILLALGLESRQSGFEGFMSKAQLVKKAQPYTDTDLSHGQVSI